MALKLKKYAPLLLLPLIVLICLGLWSTKAAPVTLEYLDSDTGVFDMRGVNFDTTMARVTRTVEYVPGALLSPEAFAARDDIITGTVPEGTDLATMRIRILVPDDGRQYGVSGYSVNYASSVYVNGKWLFDEGKPGLTLADERSAEANRLFSAQPQDGVIEILIQTSSFSNIDTSSGMSWYVGDYELLRVHFTRQITIDIVVIGWYIIAALISLLMFTMQPGYRAAGWLAVLALVWGLRTGLKNTKILLTLFPYFEWPAVYKAEILTSPITIALLALILHSAFPGALPRWLRVLTIGGALAGALAILLLPWQTFLGHSGVTNQMIYAMLAVMLLCILLSLRRRRFTLPQVIILCGIVLALFAFVWDADYFIHGELPFALTQPMLVVFSLFMLVAIVLDTMRKTVEQETLLGQRIEKQEQQLTDSRVAIMLSQIHPHFLYNSLTAIGELCDTSPGEAKTAVTDFGHFLRGNLESLQTQGAILFNEELSHVEAYLSMEKLRYKDRLRVEYDIQVRDFALPSLTVQPLVENAVQHGLMKKPEGGTVKICARMAGQAVQVVVEDDGVGFAPAPPQGDGRSHIGIENVRSRLAAVCGGTLDIQSSPGQGTRATITIPHSMQE